MVGKFLFCNIVQQITGGGKEQNSRADVDMLYALLIILMISSEGANKTILYDHVSNDGLLCE